MTLLVIGLYLAGVLTIGILSHRLFRGTGEDYFVATRSIGPFVLLMSLVRWAWPDDLAADAEADSR